MSLLVLISTLIIFLALLICAVMIIKRKRRNRPKTLIEQFDEATKGQRGGKYTFGDKNKPSTPDLGEGGMNPPQ